MLHVGTGDPSAGSCAVQCRQVEAPQRREVPHQGSGSQGRLGLGGHLRRRVREAARCAYGLPGGLLPGLRAYWLLNRLPLADCLPARPRTFVGRQRLLFSLGALGRPGRLPLGNFGDRLGGQGEPCSAAILACSSGTPSPWITARGVPTGTRVPGGTSSCPTVPDSKHSTSMAALSVSTTATTSPLRTRSPGPTSHSCNTPSSMSAPSEGMVNSVISARPPGDRLSFRRVGTGRHGVADGATCGGDDSADLGQRGLLQPARVRHGHFGAAHPLHGGIEVVEVLLGEACRDLRRKAAGAPSLVDDDRTVGARDGVADGGVVQGAQATQVDDLRADAVVRQVVGGGECLGQRAAVGDQETSVPGRRTAA